MRGEIPLVMTISRCSPALLPRRRNTHFWPTERMDYLAWNVMRLVFKDGNDRCARGGVNAAAAYDVMRPRLFRRSPFFKMDINHCPQ
ncbi:hypothetical protein C8Q74DRAFT_1241645 [Fomes fomentarius]|nr:hypothetical protein C8Q74DRAFT_1241645 [Fomes fomentarius]